MTAVFLFSVAAMQIVSGVLLDKFGCKKTVFGLLIIAAIGSYLFSTGHIQNLYIGRIFLGIGMSACWTAAFKINSELWSEKNLPVANGLIIGLAGIGALIATFPVHRLLSFITWQETFSYLSIVILVVAAFILLARSSNNVVTNDNSDDALGLKGFAHVLSNKTFITVAPLSIVCQGVWLSYQGLWSGLWLKDVNGFNPDEISVILLYLAFFVVVGNLLVGFIAKIFERAKLTIHHAMLFICAVFILSQILVYLKIPNNEYLWIVFGFCVSGPIVAYAIITNAIEPIYSGRALSLLNLFATLAGFIMQYLIGVLIDFFGNDSNYGHEISLLLVIFMQVICLLWMAFRMQKNKLANPF